MDDHTHRLTEDAGVVRSAAERLERDAADPACVGQAAQALTSVEHALHALSRACYAAGRSIIPPVDAHASISARYASAAAHWPGPEAPSNEQQARLLVALHDSAAALRAAGECTARASDLLASTIPAGDRPELRRHLAA